MAKHVYIKELIPNSRLEGVYAIQNCQLGQTRNGKPYIKCLLCDKTGRTPGRMWNATEEIFKKLPTDGFVFIAGITQPYQGEMQIVIDEIGAVQPSPGELIELLPSSKFDPDEMFAELSAILYNIKNQAIKSLVDCYLVDV